MRAPLVTVVCLSYNHEEFVKEAVESVVSQTYPHIQIIVVDDASTDHSQSVIRDLKEHHQDLEILLLEKNVGNCAAFNRGFALAKGDFIIDFAADDIMRKDRIEKQVAYFERSGDDVGIIFTDATYVDAHGRFIRNHFDFMRRKGLITGIPHGDVYRDVLAKYFIPSPTAMTRRVVLEQLGGYDEKLAYEDFDLFVRASRNFKFEYLDEKLTDIRKLAGSMSTGWYVPGDKQLMSTYRICLKAIELNRDEKDRDALITRVRYEFRQSVITNNHDEAALFYSLLLELNGQTWIDRIGRAINELRLPLRGLRNLYHRIRFGRDDVP